jgi:hypothetical protein
MRNSVGKCEFAVTRKTIQDQGKVLVTLHIAGTFEKFIQNSADNNS